MRTGVLVLPAHLICHVTVWVKKNVLPPLVPCHLWQVRKLALGGHESERTALPLTSFSTWDGRHSTSPGQHIRADPVGGGPGGPGL